MNSKLQKLFDALELDTEKLLKILSTLTDDQLNYSPSSDRWSISQILIHVLTSERMALSYMKKKSLGMASLKNSGWLESVKLLFLILSQRVPLKYKAPGVIVKSTPETIPFHALVSEWKITRNELKFFLEGIEEQNIHKKIFKNPIAGMFDALQGIQFLREHLMHHTPQIKRLIKK